jgi:glycosyltransferase involved in cell wall biosynthesis
MLRRLIFVTQTIDAEHPNLAQTIDLVRALSPHCGEIVVLTDRVRRHDLPENVTFRIFGARTRAGRAWRYLAALLTTLRSGRPDALVAHMSPYFLILAAPLLKPAGVPLVLWYTHWRADHTLRLADRLASLVCSVDRASYPLPSRKVRPIGHAIDVDAFRPRLREPGGDELHLLALGKTDPWKDLPVLLDAVERLAQRGVQTRLEIRGPQLTEAQRRHRAELEARVASNGLLGTRVQVRDAVPREHVPDLIRAADAVVSPGGVRNGGEALDKVLFEAAACAVPPVASHPSLEAELSGLPVRLWFRPGDADDLADVLAGLARASAAERLAAGRRLREWVERKHSVSGWAERLVAAIEEVARR